MTELLRAAADRVGAATDRAGDACRGAVRAADRDSIVELDARGGRAREAVHQHLALHQVRRGEPVLHDGQRPRAWTSSASATGITQDYPRAADMPGAGFAAGPCLFKDTMQLAAFSDNNFALGHSAMLVNEGLPLYLVEPARAAVRPADDDRRHPRHGLQGRVSDDIRVEPVATSSSASCEFKAARGLDDRPVCRRSTSTCSRWRRCWQRCDLLIVATPHAEYRGLSHGQAGRSTSGTCSAPACAYDRSPPPCPRQNGDPWGRCSSPARPASSAATSSRSCSPAATRWSASTTTRSTARCREVLRRPPRLPASSRATPATSS